MDNQIINNISNETKNSMIYQYNLQMTLYNKTVNENQTFFEITKCCGYSEFLTSFKHSTLTEFYNNVSYQFQMDVNKITLYALSNEEKLLIPNVVDVTIKQFILDNRQFFKPVYPIPANIVYKIIYDDGHSHTH